MVRVNGIITEDIKIEKIDISPIKIGAWAHIDQGNGEVCSGLIWGHNTLGYCHTHEQELARGAKVELNGIMIKGEDNHFLIVNERAGVKIIN